MKKLRFKTLRAKILAGFFVVLFLTLYISVSGGIMTYIVNQNTTNIVEEDLPLLMANERLAYNMAERIAASRAYILYGDEVYKEDFERITEESIEHQEYLLSNSDFPQMEYLVERSMEWRAIVEDIFIDYDNGNIELATQRLRDEAQPIAIVLMGGFQEMAESQSNDVIEEGQEQIRWANIFQSIAIGAGIIAVVIGVIIAIYTSNQISRPVKMVSTRMQQIAAGDLSQEQLQTKSQDEIGQLVDATNKMTDQMRALLSQITEVSGTVTAQSEELTQSADEVKQGAEQVAVTMQELSTGADAQANHSSEISETIELFATKANTANSNGQGVYESSQGVLELTTEGSQRMKESVGQMTNIDQVVSGAVERVQGLDQQAQNISQLVAVIRDIAEQTNLLALNAAIEAARAGEHGKGFAVVADEVRKLAEQVTNSVGDITNIVSGIQKESNDVALSLQSGYEEVEKGKQQMELTEETFTKIDRAIANMSSRIQEITTSLSEMAHDSQSIHSSIEEIVSISEESAAGIEETTASSQQTSSSMEEMAESSGELARLAQDLQDSMKKFKL